MIKSLFVFIFVIFCSALLTSFEGAYASKREARQSLDPTREHYYIISPFENTSTFGVKPKKEINNNQKRRN